jgi:acyl-CoA hydrolase
MLLSLMDKVAYVCASKHAGSYCVTVAVDGVEFLEPVEVGEMVTMHALVHYVGRSSLVVGIKVVAEDFRLGTVKHTNTSYFTMVAKDENGQPREVPGLILESKEEAKRFLIMKRRKELKSQFNKDLQNAKQTLPEEQMHDLLRGERAKLELR